MNARKHANYADRLNKRRNEIMTTLQHLEKERRVVDENLNWLDQASYESRLGLLDRLTAWYVDEASHIDRALIRIAENNYGMCIGCHQAIEPGRLDIAPETAFCSACQDLREKLSPSNSVERQRGSRQQKLRRQDEWSGRADLNR